MGVRELRPRVRSGRDRGAAAGCGATARARIPDAGPALPEVQTGALPMARGWPRGVRRITPARAYHRCVIAPVLSLTLCRDACALQHGMWGRRTARRCMP